MGDPSPTEFYAKKFGIRTPFVTVHSQMTDRGGLLSPDFSKLDAAAQIKIKKKRCLLNSPQPYDIVQVQKIQAVVSLSLLIAGRGHYGY